MIKKIILPLVLLSLVAGCSSFKGFLNSREKMENKEETLSEAEKKKKAEEEKAEKEKAESPSNFSYELNDYENKELNSYYEKHKKAADKAHKSVFGF